jgi:hypothetical protein
MNHSVTKICSLVLLFLVASCTTGNNQEEILVNVEKKLISGQNVEINYEDTFSYDSVEVKLKSLSNNNIIEDYGKQLYGNSYLINRFLKRDISHNDTYYFEILFSGQDSIEVKSINIDIEPSIIVESFCATENCVSLSGNIVQNTINTLSIKAFKIAPVKIEYIITTPYETFQVDHEFNSPTDEDWLDNLVFNDVPLEISSYINSILIKAYDIEGNVAETALPFKVVRPIEVKHFGKYELAETYEPVPVTGCIPGSIGNNVQYSESQSETKQNSVSITFSNNWSNSNSSSLNTSSSEGISVSETENTILSSSLSESETFGETETNSSSEGASTNINFSSNDGETWGWNIGESETQGTGTSNTNSTNTGVNGSVTTGFSAEGKLPFIAKASGKVEVTAGVSAGWGNSNTQSANESNTASRGYSTSGTSQNGRSFGSANNESRSHSLSGSYVLSSSTSNTITESSGSSSGRVWNMSESIGSGKIVSEGNSETLSETIVTSSTSSTTFSYSAYIPRGRYGVFYRQTSRYVKLSEVITYDLNGFPSHAGYIIMNSWAWAPELSIDNSCENMPQPNLPEAICHIPPCGE